MRRMWAAGAVIVMCLTLGGLVVAAQSPLTSWAVQGTITGCVEAAPGSTTHWGSSGRQIRDLIVSCTFEKGADEAWVGGDARLVGTGTDQVNIDIPMYASGMFDPRYSPGAVRWGTTEIAGPDGTWVGPWIAYGGSPYVLVAEGTGEYSGLTLVASMPATIPTVDGEAVYAFEGIIYEGTPPPFGPLPSAPSE